MNYKIRVANEAESKEVQDFAKSDGYSRKYNRFTLHKGWVCLNSKNDILCVCHSQAGNELDDYKEITLPEFRDLVVLKRNDPNDATHYRNDGKEYFQTFDKERHYHFQDDAWVLSTWMNYQLLPQLKPITKEPVMKEYLNKLTEGTYKLAVLSDVIDGHDGLIEIPEGAEIYTKYNGSNEFYKSKNGIVYRFNKCCWTETSWDSISKILKECDRCGFDVLWQRHTQPEQLPFVDDEPSLNDQYAEIEQVRQASITDTLNERQSTYGDFKDVANTTQYLLQMLSTDAMSDVQLEALHMICSKLARIAHGDPNYKDNWHDIAGYATLVERSL